MSAKTYGGSSWSSVQAKVEHDQKVKGLLNVFGVYDYTNDKMYTRCYKQKKSSSQFIDFINKVDSLCDPSIKQVFIVLDNASIHRSKKTKEAMKKKHPRIVLVFLPTKAPELNLIEVRWMWICRGWPSTTVYLKMSQILERQYLIGPRIIIKLTVIQPVIFYSRYSSLCRHSS